MYYKNDGNGAIALFAATAPAGWTLLTQPEIDAYLLVEAKTIKINELKNALDNFCEAGYVYSGNTFALCDQFVINMNLKENLLSYESDGISAVGATNKYILPSGHKQHFYAGQVINVSNCGVGANNGVKNVTAFSVNDLTVAENLSDEAAGEDIDFSANNRYKFYDIDNVQVVFLTTCGFDNFKESIFQEKDRIMVKYNDYKAQITACTTIAQIDAITINFSV